jgi:hypothetical protein
MASTGPRVPFNETINLADSDTETRPRSASAAVSAPLPSFLSKKSVSAWAPPADAVRRPQAMGAVCWQHLRFDTGKSNDSQAIRTCSAIKDASV